MNKNDFPKFPDPGPDELWLHITRKHNWDMPAFNIVELSEKHLLAHVRGHFTNGIIHFHEDPRNDE